MLNSFFTTTHLQTSRKLHQELPFPSETFQHQLQIWLQNSPCLSLVFANDLTVRGVWWPQLDLNSQTNQSKSLRL